MILGSKAITVHMLFFADDLKICFLVATVDDCMFAIINSVLMCLNSKYKVRSYSCKSIPLFFN